MRASIRIVLTAACLICGIAAFAKAFAGEEKMLRGTVSKVSDGDTIHFDDAASGETLKIRMVGIDAPEAHLPIPGGGPMVGQGKWGDAATAALERLTPVGTKVVLQDLGLDKYGRTLGRYFYRGRDVNLQMVRLGQAVPYVICDGPSCDRDFFEREKVEDYLKACDEARAAGRGLFNPAHPLREMPYEFRLRMQKRTPDKFVGDFADRSLHEPTEIRAVDVCRRIFFLKREYATRLGFHF
ncbi:MAG: thermonuclease family protein [Deltaproteobacteria bacterium]|nr:thermonuclease family protein [Deltaproteobacteria bacterium]